MNNDSLNANSQKYLFCLLFYENLMNYKKLNINTKKREQEKEIDFAYISKNINLKIFNNFEREYDYFFKESNLFIQKCLLIISSYAYDELFHRIFYDIYQSIYEQSIIHIEKIITNLILEILRPTRRLYLIAFTLFDNIYTLEG